MTDNCRVNDCQKRLLVADIRRWKAYHKEAVLTKRGVSGRLKAALAALQQIYTVCQDNTKSNCDKGMALDFVHQVARDGFEKTTHNLPRGVWIAEQDVLAEQEIP
jgi:hypothetical protein